MTTEQQQLLDTRKAQFPAIHEQRIEILITFFKDLVFENAVKVMFEAKNFLQPFSDWMKNQEVTADNRSWITLRCAYFIGEYFLQRYAGNWYVNERPESKFFAKIVVGKFNGVRQGVCVDPFNAAMEYIDAPEGRDLSLVCLEINAELEKYLTPNV